MERVIGLARGHWQLAGLTLLIVALWQSPVLLPLRILVVFFHELSHALATIATGGTVVAMSINAMEGGQVTSLGGNRFLVLSAGYTGSLLIGVALVVLAVRTSWDRLTVGLLGVIMLLVAAAYLRDAFALAFTGAAGAALALCAYALPRDVNDLILRLVGLTSMIYAPLDLISYTITRPHLRSDARMLAEEFGGTALIWGWLWLLISLGVIVLTLRRGLGPDSNIRLPLRRG